MLLVIHNLPSSTRYGDVKSLIQTHCGLTNAILDNLMSEGINKKITVGVADEADAVLIGRKLNGLILAGNKLQVEDMRHNKEKPYSSNKTASRWNQPQYSNNPPSLLGTNSLNLGQNSIMSQNNMMMGLNTPMGQNSSMMEQNSLFTRANNSMIGQNPGIMDQNSSMMGLNSSIMGQKGQIAPLMGQNTPMVGQNSPMMVPPPLMGYPAPTPFSGPFYMCPQNNDYGNNNSGQQSATQYPDRKDTEPSQNYGFPDTGSRRNVPDKPISVWASSELSDYSSRGYSGNERERYESRQTSSSRRTKWDDTQEVYQSVGTRNTSKRIRPWADDSSQYRRSAEYGSFDRSHDRGQDRYSRRPDSRRPVDSGANAYQRRPYESSHSGSKHRNDSPPGFRKGSSRYSLRSRDGRSPPPKRFRAEYSEPNYKPGLSYTKDKKPAKKVKLTLQKIIERDVVWRSQAAAELVKDMFMKIKTKSVVPQNVAFQKMKMAVRNRLLIILNNRLEVKISDQLVLYRRRFKTDEDQCLYNRVIRHVLHDLERNPAEAEAEEEAVTEPAQSKVKQPAKTIVKLAPAPVEQVIAKLPKYPQGDKAAYKLHKQQFKKELMQQIDPTVNPIMKKAMDDEIDPIIEIILAESVDPQHDGESMFCKRISEPAIMEEVKKMLALNVAKRILNLGTVPLVRILGVPKPPRKAPLEEFLKTRGVISLKKSDRRPMYIANCQSYESFDNLCALKDVVIDNVKVLFKPMYLTPPLEKVKHKKKQQKRNTQLQTPDDTNAAGTKIKEEIVTPVKKTTSVAKIETAIKNEVVTPKNQPGVAVSSEIKNEIETPVKGKATANPSTQNQTTDTDTATKNTDPESTENTVKADWNEISADGSQDVAAEAGYEDDYNEEDYAEYAGEDNSEVYEEDLEDY